MPWHVQYRKDGSDRIARLPSPEAAVEAACNLIDDGCDVFGIGTGPLTDSIERDQIARIYASWARVKIPFHKIPNGPTTGCWPRQPCVSGSVKRAANFD